MNTKTILLVLAICSYHPGVAQPTSDHPRLYEYLKAEGKNPSAYLIGKFANHDVILLGEDHGVRENLLFIAGLIPKLYAAGVRNIAMEFGASEDQSMLDSLVTADRYDDQTARDIMFHYNVGWAYKEYTDLYRAAWELNRKQHPGARKFRIINMSYVFDWNAFDGHRSRITMEKVFSKGPIDIYRADLINSEIIRNGEKVLILTGTPHAYIKQEFPGSTENPYQNADLGARLFDRYPGRIFSIMLHQPFEIQESDTAQITSSGEKVIERMIKKLGNRPIGFDLRTDSVSSVTDSGTAACGHSGSGPGCLFNGYIFLTPLEGLTGCTLDSEFFKHKSWEDILRGFPDPDWHKRPESLSEFWIQIKDFVDLRKRYHQSEGK